VVSSFQAFSPSKLRCNHKGYSSLFRVPPFQTICVPPPLVSTILEMLVFFFFPDVRSIFHDGGVGSCLPTFSWFFSHSKLFFFNLSAAHLPLRKSLFALVLGEGFSPYFLLTSVLLGLRLLGGALGLRRFFRLQSCFSCPLVVVGAILVVHFWFPVFA